MITWRDLYSVLTAVVPLYVAMILAYGSVRWWRIFSPEQCSGINRFVAIFAVPLLSFHFISTNDPYAMNFRFVAADTLQKVIVLAALALWARLATRGSLDWSITLFSLSTLPNTLVMGIPLLIAMYGPYSGSLMVQIVVLQCIIWYTIMLFLFEYRAARILIADQFPDTAASIVSFRVDSDVTSLDGGRDLLQAEAEVGGDGKIHVTVRKSTSSRRSISLMTPRPSNLTGAEIYSLSSSRNPTPRGSNFNHSDFFAMCGGAPQPPLRQSNFGPGDLHSVQSSTGPTPRSSNFDEHYHQQAGSPRFGHYPAPNPEIAVGCSANPKKVPAGTPVPTQRTANHDAKELHMFVWSSSASPVSEVAGLPVFGGADFIGADDRSDFGAKEIRMIVPADLPSNGGNKGSGLLKKLIGEYHDENGKGCLLQLHDLPGGAKIFELVAKFCYDVKIELNSYNVAALRCAAEHLCMTENYFGGNLISQTENFLNEIFGNWKDSMKVLETCEDLLPLAEELHIVTQCINSLAMKACVDPNLFGLPLSARSSMKSSDGNILWNGISTVEKPKAIESDWWYEESSFLGLPLYKRLILAMESKGMKPENIAGSLMFYSKKYFRGLSRNSSFHDGTSRVNPVAPVSALSESEQRVLLEEIVGLLPTKKGVTSTTFVLRLLRTAMFLHASPACTENLEKRIGVQLDEAFLEDLLIPNLGYSVETLYDIDCVQRMLDHFMSTNPTVLTGSPDIVDETQLMDSVPSLTPMTMVAKLVDGYLAEVATDVNLKFPKFQALAALIPEYARPLDDVIYRAIDIYLKSHPWLTDSEREQLCRLMNCQKLSLEACTHAAQNERLPLKVVVQVLFFEQLRLRTSIAGWFFVSENMENIDDGANGNLILPKNTEIISENEIMQEEKDDMSPMGTNDMRERVAELEKECLSMKQELEKLGKPKSSWSVICKRLPKFGFGSRSPHHSS